MDGIKCMLAWMADDEANYSADELRAMAKKALGVYEQSLAAARSQVTADEAREALDWWNNKVFFETPSDYSRLKRTITTLLKERAGV